MNKMGSKKIIILIGVIFLFQSFIVPAETPEVLEYDEWKILGITTVKGGQDKDEVTVKLKQGVLSAVKIKVRAAPLEMNKFEIHFRNGEKQKVAIRKNFTKGSESRAIDLKGDKRLIKKVVFWYKKKNKGGNNPLVVLIGRE